MIIGTGRRPLLHLARASSYWLATLSVYFGSVKTFTTNAGPARWFLAGAVLYGCWMWLRTRERNGAVVTPSLVAAYQMLDMAFFVTVTWAASFAAPSTYRATALAALVGVGEGIIVGYLLYLAMLTRTPDKRYPVARLGPTLTGAGALLLLGRQATTAHPATFIIGIAGATIYTAVVAVSVVAVRKHMSTR